MNSVVEFEGAEVILFHYMALAIVCTLLKDVHPMIVVFLLSLTFFKTFT